MAKSLSSVWLAIGSFSNGRDVYGVLDELSLLEHAPEDVCLVGSRDRLAELSRCTGWQRLQQSHWRSLADEIAKATGVACETIVAGRGAGRELAKAVGLVTSAPSADSSSPGQTLLTKAAAQGRITIMVQSPSPSVHFSDLRVLLGHAAIEVQGHELRPLAN